MVLRVEHRIVRNGSTSLLLTDWVERFAKYRKLMPEYIRLRMKPPQSDAPASSLSWPCALERRCDEEEVTAGLLTSLSSTRPVWEDALVALQAEQRRIQDNLGSFTGLLARITSQVNSNAPADMHREGATGHHITEALFFYTKYACSLFDIANKEWNKIPTVWSKEIDGYMGLKSMMTLAKLGSEKGRILLLRPVKVEESSGAPQAGETPRQGIDVDCTGVNAINESPMMKINTARDDPRTEDPEACDAGQAGDIEECTLDRAAIETLKVYVNIVDAIIVHAKALNFGKVTEMDAMLRQIHGTIRDCDNALRECVAVFGPTAVEKGMAIELPPAPEEPSDIEKSLVKIQLSRDARRRRALHIALGEEYPQVVSKSLLEIARGIHSLFMDPGSYVSTQLHAEVDGAKKEEDTSVDAEGGNEAGGSMPTADDLSLIESTYFSSLKDASKTARARPALLPSRQMSDTVSKQLPEDPKPAAVGKTEGLSPLGVGFVSSTRDLGSQ